MRIENNTTTYLVILSLILTCGFFVSNLAFQKNYSQKYDETQRSIQLLNETSQNFQENILAVILRVDSLESRLSGISSELVSYEYSIMELENEIETLNDRVDYIDMQLLVNKWLIHLTLLPEDLNRDSIVNFFDFAEFVEQWLWQEI